MWSHSINLETDIIYSENYISHSKCVFWYSFHTITCQLNDVYIFFISLSLFWFSYLYSIGIFECNSRKKWNLVYIFFFIVRIDNLAHKSCAWFYATVARVCSECIWGIQAETACQNHKTTSWLENYSETIFVHRSHDEIDLSANDKITGMVLNQMFSV